MDNFSLYNNFSDAICIFSKENEIVYTNNIFSNSFTDYDNLERFKQRFNFDLCFLSYENIQNKTPIDFLLKSKENFHTVCTYQNNNGEYSIYYISKFEFNGYKTVIFKDITPIDRAKSIEKQYKSLQTLYNELKETNEKYSQLQEHAQSQVLKMGILNRISLVIRETNNIETVLASALSEIHNLLGSFKTYFSMKEKGFFKVIYSVSGDDIELNLLTEYEKEVTNQIKNKSITVSSCLKEFINSKDILSKGTTRIIIPVYNKNRLLGIIVTFTKQKINVDENKELLQSISVQLGSSIIQSGLITQLNKKNKKLQKTLSELKETQMQLINTEKMASLGQLVSGIAHEINTPLASICSNNNLINKILIEKEISKNQIEMLKELNSIDIEAADRISNMVKSLKKFVRLDEAEFQEADINKELDLTLKLIAHEIKDKITIIKNYSQLPPVLCSVNMLNQVFMNLLVNACHSIKDTNRAGTITVTTQTDNNCLIVKIKDTGIGIQKNIQDKIFTVGFTTKKAGIGTGLGLSISKKIVELHKGNISFTSEPGEGSEFKVSIPINNVIQTPVKLNPKQQK